MLADALRDSVESMRASFYYDSVIARAAPLFLRHIGALTIHHDGRLELGFDNQPELQSAIQPLLLCVSPTAVAAATAFLSSNPDYLRAVDKETHKPVHCVPNFTMGYVILTPGAPARFVLVIDAPNRPEVEPDEDLWRTYHRNLAENRKAFRGVGRCHVTFPEYPNDYQSFCSTDPRSNEGKKLAMQRRFCTSIAVARRALFLSGVKPAVQQPQEHDGADCPERN